MAPSNAFDEIVTKATDENLTGENWELILNICDKVSDEGEAGARNVIASVLRRLAHRNPNVQLYALTLAESLSKNCGLQVNREISSRSFTQGLEKLIADRTTHEKVRKRTLSLIAIWTAEFESDPQLGIMEECYSSLRAKNYSFEPANEPPPPQVDDEIRRREEEELQRVLEMSMHDKGGRSQWQSYNGGSSSGPGASSTAGASGAVSSSSSHPQQQSYSAAPASSSYVSAGSPSPGPQVSTTASPVRSNTMPTSPSQPAPVSRVRALYTFEPTDKGELAFDKGDIIRVVDRNYKDWWRGQLRGRTGIFPVNYIEPLPEPSPADISKEAEQEAALFAQAASIDKLLGMLRGLDPMKDNLADDEEIQELYRSSMALRPKIVKLIDKYNQKRAELVMMNESFIKARTIFDRMMEESLARHTGFYDGRPNYGPSGQGGPGPDARPPADYRQSVYTSAGPVPYGGMQAPAPGPQQYSQPYVDPNTPYPQGYPQHQPQHGYPTQATPTPYSQPIHTATDSRPFSTQPQSQLQSQQPQPYGQPAPQQQQSQQQSQQQQPDPAVINQSQPQTQTQPQPQQSTQGPPYVYDPNGTYADPNVHAWAQYYSKGGTDLTGAVYFISIPGIKEVPTPATPALASMSQQPQGYYAGQQSTQQVPTQLYPGNAGSDPNTSVSSLPVQSQQPAQTPGSPTTHQGFSTGYTPGQDQVYSQPQQQTQYLPEPYPASAPGSAPATGYFPQSQPQQIPHQAPNGNVSLHRVNSLSMASDAAHDQSQSSLAGALGTAPSSPTVAGPTPTFAQMQGQFGSMNLGHGMPQGQQGHQQPPHQQYAAPTPQLA